MRNDKDRVVVNVQAYFTVDVDLERVEQDPRWKAMGPVPQDQDKAKEQLFKYINQYVLSGPQLLTNAPFTNGPSSVWVLRMEILDERPSTSVS